MICYSNLDKTNKSKKLQKKKLIPSSLKREVLEALQKPGSVLTTIAKAYGISRSTIYLWRGSTPSSLIKTSGVKTDYKNQSFVEISVKEPTSLKLQKASLIFENYSLSIEGNVKLQNLIQIINILESPC